MSLLVLGGCAHKQVTKREPEIVASCFSDGEKQDQVCKTQRVDEESKVVTTRCIGSANRVAPASLRGKCVEKICEQGSNTECITRGEFGVLEQFNEIMKDRLFVEDESAPANSKKSAALPANKTVAKKEKLKKHGKDKTVASAKPVAPAEADIDTDPSAHLPPDPVKEEPPPQPLVKKAAPTEESAEPPPMEVTLKPAKPTKKVRAAASVRAPEGFKKVCIAKSDASAPEALRGKCAIRNCTTGGKCHYKGRKEMFEYVARSAASAE
jgi:hypothetical protein